MKKIKVIHIVERLDLGGLEKVVEGICLRSDKHKYDVSVYCVTAGGEIAAYLQSRDVTVKILEIKHYYNPFNIIKLCRELKKDNPDIVQTHGYFASVIGRSAAVLAGVNVIINHVHTAFYNLKPRNVLIDKFLGKFTDEVIYVSNASRKSFSAKGYKTGRSIIIYNGVDSFAFKVNRNLLKKRVITIVASLKDFKGHIYLLKAIRRVLEEMPDLELWIVGDGPLRPDLEKSAEALGIGDSVFFLGRKDNIGDILGETSVFALSSLREGLPVALVEALASGLPVIGTNAGGIPEVIKDKENGFVVLAGEERALSKAILDIFNNPEKLEKMGLRSRELFEQYFSLNIMINKLDVLYQNLLKKKR